MLFNFVLHKYLCLNSCCEAFLCDVVACVNYIGKLWMLSSLNSRVAKEIIFGIAAHDHGLLDLFFIFFFSFINCEVIDGK
ncbi:CLUMA_CG005232, isoform A [Clunio marinus]|uniref:CLUMA_CG005232, isoform A n=1 Tax=Clunio marinus TaxID=568069 RepID=A0A1J1HVJ5_9DIPT|nr:CLUMA_CG005232, isoform A [Clunio marinus]